jgi:xanthine dehydrogenase iron-sulfur cluster and FAD-binding subunit A
MTAKAMLDKNPHPTDAQIRETMNSTLCRCFSRYRVQTAIKRVVTKGVVGSIEDASPANAPVSGKEALA